MSGTVTASKETFISAQVRLLSQPLELPPDFEEQSEIPTKSINHAMTEANRLLRRHNKSAYDALAIRTTAEQIDNMYWEAAAPDVTVDADRWYDEGTIKRDEDLTEESVIARLSLTSYSSEKFDALHKSLQAMSAQRTQLRQKLEFYGLLRKQIEMLRRPHDSVQPNLVTRDGVLVDELSKSKMLGIGVAGRVAGMKRPLSAADNDEPFTIGSQTEKIKRVLKEC